MSGVGHISVLVDSRVTGTLGLGLGHVLDAWDEPTLSSLAPPRTRFSGYEEEDWWPCEGGDSSDAVAEVTALVLDWLAGRTENRGLALYVSGCLDERNVMAKVCTPMIRCSNHLRCTRSLPAGRADEWQAAGRPC